MTSFFKKGFRLSLGLLSILILIGCIVRQLSLPYDQFIDNFYIEIPPFFILMFLIYYSFKPWIDTEQDDDKKATTISTPSNYENVLNKYYSAEQDAFLSFKKKTKSYTEELQTTTNPQKKIFLQSIINHYKYRSFSALFAQFYYTLSKMIEDLDPSFEAIAKIIIKNPNLNDIFEKELVFDPSRKLHIIQQLVDCEIIEYDETTHKCSLLVKKSSQLKRILKRTNGKSLLSISDKQKLNQIFEKRKAEILNNAYLKTTLTDIPESTITSYLSFINAFRALAKTDKIKEITESGIWERCEDINRIFTKNFCYVEPLQNGIAPNINYLYFYPTFIVKAISPLNFDIIPLEKVNVKFSTKHVKDEWHSVWPTDSTFIRTAYKYETKDGQQDYRYRDNDKFSVFEYGALTFEPFGLTLLFSNTQAAKNFYQAFEILKNGTINPIFSCSKSHCESSITIANSVFTFFELLSSNADILRSIRNLDIENIDTPEEKLEKLFLIDLIKGFILLGHNSEDLFNPEGLTLSLVESQIHTRTSFAFLDIQSSEYSEIVRNLCFQNKVLADFAKSHLDDDFFGINEVLKLCNRKDLIIQYFSLLYRLFSVIAKADGTITEKECQFLEKLMSQSKSTTKFAVENEVQKRLDIMVKNSNQLNEKDLQKNITQPTRTAPIEKLRSLIGLSRAKSEIETLTNFVKIQKEREAKGLKTIGLSYHCVFTGNPGTGKTTVARIVAEIYKDLGLLAKGHLVETDRSGLIAEYVGQTAVKTNNIIDSALDGVLFIDEAYSLIQGSGNDYGLEAIATLLKRMEDDRNRLVVILAGYDNEMTTFINSNPGLQSRFNRYIHFDDYDIEELKEIFLLNAKNAQYKLTPEAIEQLAKVLTEALNNKDKNFGNGRFVRNLFEKTLQNQANRLAPNPQTTTKDLSTITTDDIITPNP